MSVSAGVVIAPLLKSVLDLRAVQASAIRVGGHLNNGHLRRFAVESNGACQDTRGSGVERRSGRRCGSRGFLAATTVKRALGYDDSLDAFGVHAVGGIVGALLTGIFAANTLGVFSGSEEIDIVRQFGIQCAAVAFTILWCGVGSFIILKGIDLTIGLRVDEDEESEGLDISLHSESGYIL